MTSRRPHGTYLITGLLALIVAVIMVAPAALANEISRIQTDVELQTDGSARITQVWDVEASQGTEMYIPQTNLRDMQIVDFTVSENGVVFTDMGTNWDVGASREEKAYTSGIVITGDGVELCWGIGEYGSHSYTLDYTLTNAVQSYPDHDGFLIRFVNDELSSAPDEVITHVSVPGVELSTDNSRIWAFGYRGTILFEGGGVIAQSSEPFSSNSHMTIMMRFEKGMFSPISIGEGTFDELRLQAFEGSEYTDLEDQDDPFASSSGGETDLDDPTTDSGSGPVDGILSTLGNVFSGGLGIAIVVGIITMLRGGIFKRLSGGLGGSGSSVNVTNKRELNTPVDASYFYRDVPMKGYLPAHYFLAQYTTEPIETENLIAGYMLRWIRSGAARMETVTESRKQFFIFDREHTKTSLILDPARTFPDAAESSLYRIFLDAAQSDAVLEDEEFKAWSTSNYEEVEDWLELVSQNGEAYAHDNGFFISEQKKFLFITYDEYTATPAAVEASNQVQGFKKFITDFTLMRDNPPGHVQVWDDYIIVAAVYGLAEKAMESLQGLYPEYQFAGMYGTGVDAGIPFWIFYGNLGNFAQNSTAGKAAYEASSLESSFGGGGGASFGGGGGFSGGGSGGGFR